MKYVPVILILLSFISTLSAQVEQSQRDSSLILKDTTKDTLPPTLLKSFKKILEDTTKKYSGNTDKDLEGLDLGLFVVNNTRTRYGARFYDEFYQKLSLETNPGSATVIVDEEPFRGRMTRLIVKVNDTEIIQTILRPNAGDYLDQLVAQSVQKAQYYIQNYQKIQESLNGEDLSGSGIY